MVWDTPHILAVCWAVFAVGIALVVLFGLRWSWRRRGHWEPCVHEPMRPGGTITDAAVKNGELYVTGILERDGRIVPVAARWDGEQWLST